MNFATANVLFGNSLSAGDAKKRQFGVERRFAGIQFRSRDQVRTDPHFLPVRTFL
jgi:hypothetical protein